MGHSDGIGNLIKPVGQTMSQALGGRSQNHKHEGQDKARRRRTTCTRTLRQSSALTRDLATHRAAYAAERSTLV